MLLTATAQVFGFSAEYGCSNTRGLSIKQNAVRGAAAVRNAPAMMSAEADAEAARMAALIAHLRAPIRQYDGGLG